MAAGNGDAQQLRDLEVALTGARRSPAPVPEAATDDVVARVDAAAELCREVGRYASDHGRYLDEISAAFAGRLQAMTKEYAANMLAAEERKMDEVRRILGEDRGMTINIRCGDCREILRTLPDASVHCVVTSPPYWGLRDYGVDGQLGMEASLGEYVDVMVGVFREVRRVLRDDGTLWLNLGDSYAGSWSGNSMRPNGGTQRSGGPGFQPLTDDRYVGRNGNTSGLKPKDLCGIPWRVAFALQADGWYLRQDIIWSKPNPMPESVTDRCTKAHEYLFLLSKRERYYYDQDAIREESSGRTDPITSFGKPAERQDNGRSFALDGMTGRNKRSVWEVTTQPFSEAHFATFPPALIEPCIKAGTSEKGCCGKCGKPWVRQVERSPAEVLSPLSNYGNGAGRNDGNRSQLVGASTTTLGWLPACACGADPVPCTVLDPFAGAGTTGLVADRLQRNAILIELNPAYAAMSQGRITDDSPLFAEVMP